MSEIRRKPEGYDDMMKKLIERIEEGEQKQIEKKSKKMNIPTEEVSLPVLLSIAKRENQERSLGTEHKPIKNPTVIREPTNPEILTLAQNIEKETSELGQRITKELGPHLKTLESKIVTSSLPGRIKKGPPEQA